MEIGSMTDWLLDRSYGEIKAPFIHQSARGAPTGEIHP
jgi:hypothetical protein